MADEDDFNEVEKLECLLNDDVVVVVLEALEDNGLLNTLGALLTSPTAPELLFVESALRFCCLCLIDRCKRMQIVI